MRASDSRAADDAIAAIQAGLDRFFAEVNRQQLHALRCAITRQIEADIALLDALAVRLEERAVGHRSETIAAEIRAVI